jgi:hypothetical protein
VASSLMKAGAPAVVAMRYRVGDGSAVAFSDAFYRALALSLPIDAAVTAARLAIDDTEDMFWQWATPALFMSSADGLVFQFAGAREKEAMEAKRLGVRTRLTPYGDLEEECQHVLNLVPLFDGRTIKNPADWSDKVVPYMDHFFRQHVSTRRPLVLRFDAHLTVSFTAGWLIDTRGVDVTIRQAAIGGGFQDWRFDFDHPYQGKLWKVREERVGAGKEVAVAVGITNDNLKPVKEYVERDLSDRVGRILAVVPPREDESTSEPEGKPGNTSVRGANHAFALAQELKRHVDRRSREEQDGPLHLFLAAPGGFAFYLGQLSRGFGEIQLYEWEFEKPESKTYFPSVRLVTEEGGRP